MRARCRSHIGRLRNSNSIRKIPVHIPFSRRYLEGTLRLSNPTHKSLIAIESVWEVLDIAHGDLLLIDCNQADLALDGAYLLNLPGFSLRGVFARPQNKLRIVEPRSARGSIGNGQGRRPRSEASDSYEIDRRELLGDDHHIASKVVGRAVWVGRAI
jgi:hypothetical protein